MFIALTESKPQLCQVCFKVHRGHQDLYSIDTIKKVKEIVEPLRRSAFGGNNFEYNVWCGVKNYLEELEKYQERGLQCSS